MMFFRYQIYELNINLFLSSHEGTFLMWELNLVPLFFFFFYFYFFMKLNLNVAVCQLSFILNVDVWGLKIN